MVANILKYLQLYFFWCSLLIQKEAIVSPQQCDTDFCSDLRECVMQNVACSHRNHCVSIVQLNWADVKAKHMG